MENIDVIGNLKQISLIDNRPLMSFSCGVDSIAMWLRLKEINDRLGIFDIDKAFLFYMYFIPGMPFVDDYIRYFEEREKVKIIQVPHNLFLESLANRHFQTPLRSLAMAKMQDTKLGFVEVTKEGIERMLKEKLGYPRWAYSMVGVKCGDSAIRRMAMRKTNGLNQAKKKVYPIADFENRDVVEIIKRHGIKVPIDYELFGISYENLQYRFAKVISERCPVTWELCKQWFPGIPYSLARYERYHPEWIGENRIKGRKGKIFADMILRPRVEI